MNCEICNKIFDGKRTLIRHYYYHSEKNIKQKELALSYIAELRKIGDFKCNICSQFFKSQKSLNEHVSRICKQNQIESLYLGINELKILLAKHCAEKSELISLSDQLLDKVSKISEKNNNLETNIKNNINGNYVENIYGDRNTLNNINNIVKVRSVDQRPIGMYDTPLENKDKIMEIFRDEKSRNNVDKMFLSIDKYFNCNPDFPDNHNILVTNARKSAPCLVKENDEWIKKQGQDVKKLFFDRICDCGELYMKYIPDKLKEFFPRLDPNKIDQMTDFIQDQYDDQSDEIKERLWYQFFLQTYNHREMLKNTYEKDLKNNDFPKKIKMRG